MSKKFPIKRIKVRVPTAKVRVPTSRAMVKRITNKLLTRKR